MVPRRGDVVRSLSADVRQREELRRRRRGRQAPAAPVPETFLISATCDSVVDEVYILNRPITAPEAKLLCERGEAAFDGTAFPAVVEWRTCNYFPSSAKLNATLAVDGRHPARMTAIPVRLTIEDAKTAKPINGFARDVQLAAVETDVSMNVDALPPGDYRLVATPLEPADAVAPAPAEFAKAARPEWIGNRIGYIDGVPKPWIPIQQKGQELAAWGRTYRYHDSLFPSQIVSQNQGIAGSPNRTCGTECDGKRVPIRELSFRVDKGNAAAGGVQGRGKTERGRRPVRRLDRVRRIHLVDAEDTAATGRQARPSEPAIAAAQRDRHPPTDPDGQSQSPGRQGRSLERRPVQSFSGLARQ